MSLSNSIGSLPQALMSLQHPCIQTLELLGRSLWRWQRTGCGAVFDKLLQSCTRPFQGKVQRSSKRRACDLPIALLYTAFIIVCLDNIIYSGIKPRTYRPVSEAALDRSVHGASFVFLADLSAPCLLTDAGRHIRPGIDDVDLLWLLETDRCQSEWVSHDLSLSLPYVVLCQGCFERFVIFRNRMTCFYDVLLAFDLRLLFSLDML